MYSLVYRLDQSDKTLLSESTLNRAGKIYFVWYLRSTAGEVNRSVELNVAIQSVFGTSSGYSLCHQLFYNKFYWKASCNKTAGLNNVLCFRFHVR